MDDAREWFGQRSQEWPNTAARRLNNPRLPQGRPSRHLHQIRNNDLSRSRNRRHRLPWSTLYHTADKYTLRNTPRTSRERQWEVLPPDIATPLVGTIVLCSF